MTYMQAALAILAYADRPLTVPELTSIAVAQGLVHPRGRTPDRSMSSILYRRMAHDPDAPISCAAGRFWLRGNSLPITTTSALRPAVRHVRRLQGVGAGQTRQETSDTRARAEHAQRATVLPPPPMLIPLPALTPSTTAMASGATDGAGRRERAVVQLERRLHSLAARIRPLLKHEGQTLEAAQVRKGIILPLLRTLGYRRVDRQEMPSIRSRNSLLLRVAGEPSLLLDIFHSGHALGDADARPTLLRAVQEHAPWALLTNGRELRLYACDLARAQSDPAAALVLVVDLYALDDDAARVDATHLLWLLSRGAVASGALDAYLANRIVGAVLLGAFEDEQSDLVQSLAQAVAQRTGLRLPAALLARHARLAVRGRRDRDGAPAATEVPVLAAVVGAPHAARSDTPREQEIAS